jgi:hypothetical protein
MLDDALQTRNGRNVYTSYVDARNSFRQGYDTLARKMEIYTDWPSDSNRDPTVQKSGDPLNSHSLDESKFECDKYRPDYRSITSLAKVDSIPMSNTTQSLEVDWGSAKHHIITFQHCFEKIHSRIIAAREWASKSPVKPETLQSFIKRETEIQSSLDELVERFDAFMILAMWRIESIRHRYQIKNYLCHLFPVARWCA